MQTQNVLDAMTYKQVNEEVFFKLAFVFCFGVTADVSTDVAQFKLHAIVPAYVLQYVKVILETK